MIFRYVYRDGVWLDLEHPTEEEVHSIAQEFGISERLQTEILTPTPSSLVASEEGMVFLVLHFPTNGANDGVIRDQEVDFLVGKNFIITVRYEVVASLHRLQKVLETQRLISSHDTLTTDVMLEILFAHLYAAVRDHTATIAERLTGIERDMFSGLERKTVRLISDISREFLHIEASLANQESSLTRFLKALALRHSFGPFFEERSERIFVERDQVSRLVSTYRAVATELRQTNASLLESRQNDIMRALTMITVLVLPLELIAVTFGIHAPGTPFEGESNGFWIIITIMLSLTGIMTIFFAKKRWLF